jgi:hypothetical protein
VTYPLKGKGAFFFCDTAGANACMSLAFLISDKTGQTQDLFSNQSRYAGNMFKLPIVEIQDPALVQLGSYDFVFTGTSHPDTSSGFELKALKAAKGKLPTISFVDHWTSMDLRFRLNDEQVYPDDLWVLDDKAQREVKSQLNYVGNLKIVDNPYHYFIRNYWRPVTTRQQLIESIAGSGMDIEQIVLYAPDPISLRNDQKKLGFDEVTVLSELLEIFKGLPRNVVLLVKPHPLQKLGRLTELINTAGLGNVFLADLNEATLDLVYHADLIIGFISNILMEGMVMGKAIIRYLPSATFSDPLDHLTQLKPVRNLKEALESIVNS